MQWPERVQLLQQRGDVAGEMHDVGGDTVGCRCRRTGPGVRQVRGQQHDLSGLERAHGVADQAGAATAADERQLPLGVSV